MNTQVFRRTLLVTCWLPIFGMTLAVGIKALLITRKPVEYIAIGKIAVGMQNQPNASPEDFYGSQIEILYSDRLRIGAMERVRGLNPDLQESAVELRVTQTKGSSTLNVVVVGREWRFTKVFLESILDEYMILRKELERSQKSGSEAGIVGEPAAIMERPVDAREMPPALFSPLVTAAIMGFGGGLVLMFVISFIAAFASPSRTNQPPPLA